MDKRIGIMLPIDDFDSILCAAREAQIRFKRLRKAVRRGDDDVSHWTEAECNEKMEEYKALEERLTDLYETTLEEDREKEISFHFGSAYEADIDALTEES